MSLNTGAATHLNHFMGTKNGSKFSGRLRVSDRDTMLGAMQESLGGTLNEYFGNGGTMEVG